MVVLATYPLTAEPPPDVERLPGSADWAKAQPWLWASDCALNEFSAPASPQEFPVLGY